MADTDADGKMNIIEFSIACKLISSKLRNVEVPKHLPPTLIQSLQHVGTPIRTPTGSMSPTEGYKQFLTQQQPAAPIPIPIQQQIQQQPVVASVPLMTQQHPQQFQTQQIMQQQQQQPIQMMQPNMMPMMNQGGVASTAPIQQPMMMQQQVAPMGMMPQQIIQPVQAIPQQMMMNQAPQQQMIVQPQPILAQQPQQIIPSSISMPPLQQQQQPQPIMATNNFVQAAPVQPMPVSSKPPLIEQLSSGSLLDSLAQVQTAAPVSGPIPAAPTPTPPQSGHASRSMSFSEKVPSPSVPESP